MDISALWQQWTRWIGALNHSGSVHSFINKEIVVQGDIQLQEGGIHIDGQVFGNIIDYSEKARVVVGRTGFVRGSITAGHLVLLGRVEGNVLCKHFEIFGDALIEGDIQYQTISIHSGRVTGRLLPYPVPESTNQMQVSMEPSLIDDASSLSTKPH